MARTHFILFVQNQNRSRDFYRAVLGKRPTLDVSGMTEFELPGGAVLGLMPSRGISRLLGPALPDPGQAQGVPRAELYLVGHDAESMFERAVISGAPMLSPFQERDWGDCVAYCLDPDGHVLALAATTPESKIHSEDLIIETARFRLRPFRLSDAKDIQKLAGAWEIAETTAAIPHPYEDGLAEAWIAGHGDDLHRRSAYHWAVTLRNGGALVGAVSLMDVDSSGDIAELGYWIAVEYWNQGYGSEAAGAVIDWGFGSLGLNRLHAHHFSRNSASGAVLKKIGMRHEGSRPQHFTRWGRREDIELFGILATDRRP